MEVFISVNVQFFCSFPTLKALTGFLFFSPSLLPNYLFIGEASFISIYLHLFLFLFSASILVYSGFFFFARHFVFVATGNKRESSSSKLAQWEGGGFRSHPRPPCMFPTGLVRRLRMTKTCVLTWVNWLIGNAALSAGLRVEIHLGPCFGFHCILTTKLVVHEACDWGEGRGKVAEVISASCGPLSVFHCSQCWNSFTNKTTKTTKK